ncbi:hypothetical protein F66182_1919 [Fusarium sp. NRRL 66182]|nr:hypothetical protein F66182_1919 [Fusarium sp. NRRL 66182]
MSLLSLPFEILSDIISLESPSILDREDLKALRLSCRQLSVITTPFLFYRIRISPLIKDHQSFINISIHQHLSQHVRILVWEELDGDFLELHPQVWRSGVRPTLQAHELQFFEDLTAQIRQLFWYRFYSSSPQESDGATTDDDSQHSTFLDMATRIENNIVNSFPNLNTLVSKPMHPRRQIELPSGYPVSVETIRTFIQRNQFRCTFNRGFTAVLIPALKRLADDADSTLPNKPRVTRLAFADEGFAHITSLTRLTADDAPAFKQLTHLNLCISGNRHRVSEDSAGFLTCLSSANSLTNLELCQEVDPEDVFDRLDSSQIPTFPRLAEVHLSDFPPRVGLPKLRLSGVVLDAIPPSSPVEFISRHAKTLRAVYITASSIPKSALEQLASLNCLQLKRFVVISGDDLEDDRQEHISEQAILNYINKITDLNQERPPPPFDPQDRDTELHTHSAIFNSYTCTAMAICDTRGNGWERRGYEPLEVAGLDWKARDQRDQDGMAHSLGARRNKDSYTGLWVDSNGVYYNPRTDEEVAGPDERSLRIEQVSDETEDDSWKIQGQRKWDPEFGLWRDDKTDKLEKFAVDREPETPEFSDVAVEKGVAPDIDMRPFYAQQDDIQSLRIEQSPNWDWGRDKDGKIWYWQVPAPSGHPTELWYFEHDGEYAYGQDPLHHWDNWVENSKDKIEPTPYGWNLVSFIKKTDDPGSKIPQEDTCESLALYNASKDPMYAHDADKSWWNCPLHERNSMSLKEEWAGFWDDWPGNINPS